MSQVVSVRQSPANQKRLSVTEQRARLEKVMSKTRGNALTPITSSVSDNQGTAQENEASVGNVKKTKTLKGTVAGLRAKMVAEKASPLRSRIAQSQKMRNGPSTPDRSVTEDDVTQASPGNSEATAAAAARRKQAQMQRLIRRRDQIIGAPPSDQDSNDGFQGNTSRSSSPVCSRSRSGSSSNGFPKLDGDQQDPTESDSPWRTNSSDLTSPTGQYDSFDQGTGKDEKPLDSKLQMLKHRRKLQHAKQQQEAKVKATVLKNKNKRNTNNSLSVRTELENGNLALTSLGAGTPTRALRGDSSPIDDNEDANTEFNSVMTNSPTMNSANDFSSETDPDGQREEDKEDVMIVGSQSDGGWSDGYGFMKEDPRSDVNGSGRWTNSNDGNNSQKSGNKSEFPPAGERVDILKGFGLSRNSMANMGRFASLGGSHDQSESTNTKDKSETRKHDPQTRAAGGLAAAAACGGTCVLTILLGPVGVIIGAASVGLGVGVLQMPEEQRASVSQKATKVIEQAHDTVKMASETLSNSCAVACENTGVGEKYPEVTQCCSQADNNQTSKDTGKWDSTPDDFIFGESNKNNSYDASSAFDEGGGNIVGPKASRGMDGKKRQAPAFPKINDGNRRVACMRKVRITPVNEIHALDPSLQPKAWLGVMASMNTTTDEKDEAMEEIMILAKDKDRARMLLEEGILDSLVWILNTFLESMRSAREKEISETPELLCKDGTIEDLAVSVQRSCEFNHAKLAALCCLALGKAHCAVVHTEGDLLLMSSYNRGTVPEERQLAQMLYEVPHHVSVIDTGNKGGGSAPGKELFTITEISMFEAEELAKSIKALTEGKQYIQSSPGYC
eukprot:scaffold29814_cov48-Attheya_sp.AAC.6